MNTLISILLIIFLSVPSILFNNNESQIEKWATSSFVENNNQDITAGLYSFKKRYYDPRVNFWLSTDPYLSNGKYFPKPQDFDTEHDYIWRSLHDESGKLPGLGGVFNPINLNVYGYAGQNPVKFIDPDGEFVIPLFLVIAATIVLTERYADTDTHTDYGKRVTENVAFKYFNKLGNGLKIGKNIYSNANQSKGNGKDFKTLDKKELSKRLGTSDEKFHRQVKKDILKDHANKKEDTNFDIKIDKKGDIVLEGNKTGKIIETKTPLSNYKKQ